MPEKLILLTNDDGILAPGLDALAAAASIYGRVVVVAPSRNSSGISSAMSVHDILRLEEVADDKFMCDGTPVDCVLMGIHCVLGREPDWILSGINWGYNLGEDVFYSGTVGAAFEGRLQGIRSAAFSLCRDGNPVAASRWVGRFLDTWEKVDLPPNAIWNINFPECEPKGFRLTVQGSRKYYDLVERHVDPRGRPYYWIGGHRGPEYAEVPGTDAEAIRQGYASITPLQMDLTCRGVISKYPEFDTVFATLAK